MEYNLQSPSMMPLYSFFKDECHTDGAKKVTKQMMEQAKSQRSEKIKTHGYDCRCYYLHCHTYESMGSCNLCYLLA